MLAELPARAAVAADLEAAAASVESAARRMGRTMETGDLRDLLARNLEHPRWDDVAERCLTCGNCTLVCPTCFCSAVEDETDLSGDEAGRWRVWDTCFSVDYSYIHGGSDPAVGTLALPAVDDAQARHVARPVRLLRVRRLRPLHHVVPGRDRHHRGGRRDPRDRGGAPVRTLETVLAEAPFLEGLDDERLALLAGCAGNVHFGAGRDDLPPGRPRRTPSTSCVTAASRSRRSFRRAARS